MDLLLKLNEVMWASLWMVITYPELILLLLAISVLILGVFNQERYFKFFKIILYGMIVTVGAGFLGRDMVLPLWVQPFLVKDGLATLSQFMIFLFVMPWILPSKGLKKQGGVGQFEYTPLVLFSVVGMFLMVSSTNLITLYLGIELQSLPLYALIGMRHSYRNTSEGALKYFILGALASAILVYGCALVYGGYGSTNYAEILSGMQASQPPLFLTIGSVFIAVGVLFKVSAAPFHMWSPDAYESSSGLQVAILSTGSKIAAFAVLCRLLYRPFYGLQETIVPLLMGVSILSLAIGAFGALWQQNIKRLIAYSSIGHVGFILLSFLIGSQGLSYLYFYLLTYGIGIVGFLLCLNYLHKNGQDLELLTDLKGLGTHHPRVAFCVSLSLFSLAGIPPLAGFWGKFYMLLGLVHQGHFLLAIYAVLASVISAFYYLKIIKYMYFEKSDAEVHFTKSWGYQVAALFLVAIVVLQSWAVHLIRYSFKGFYEGI